MKSVKILHIGDMQNGFTRENGNLYVSGAQDIISPTNNFLNQVKKDIFDVILVILDTHFTEEYHLSDEGKVFPIHCEYGTPDWELSIDVTSLLKKQYLMKNLFTMWGKKGTSEIQITDSKRKQIYNALFHVVDDPHNPSRIISREDFLTAIKTDNPDTDIEVTMIGVASDYCIRYAMEGWLARGARVTILHDLTKGIEKETLQLLEEDKYHLYKSHRLRTISSIEYLDELSQT